MLKLGKKKEILSRCFNYFTRDGYHGLSMRKLSSYLGITTGSLYHHFKNKEELFIALVKYHSSADIDTAMSLVCGIDDHSLRLEVFLNYIEERSEYFQKIILLMTDFQRQNSLTDPNHNLEVKSEIKHALDDYQHAIREILGFTRLEAGSAVLSLVIGTLLQRLVNEQAADFADLRVLMQQFNQELL